MGLTERIVRTCCPCCSDRGVEIVIRTTFFGRLHPPSPWRATLSQLWLSIWGQVIILNQLSLTSGLATWPELFLGWKTSTTQSLRSGRWSTGEPTFRPWSPHTIRLVGNEKKNDIWHQAMMIPIHYNGGGSAFCGWHDDDDWLKSSHSLKILPISLYFQKCAHKVEGETGDLKTECGYFYGYSIYQCSCTNTFPFLLRW